MSAFVLMTTYSYSSALHFHFLWSFASRHPPLHICRLFLSSLLLNGCSHLVLNQCSIRVEITSTVTRLFISYLSCHILDHNLAVEALNGVHRCSTTSIFVSFYLCSTLTTLHEHHLPFVFDSISFCPLPPLSSMQDHEEGWPLFVQIKEARGEHERVSIDSFDLENDVSLHLHQQVEKNNRSDWID